MIKIGVTGGIGSGKSVVGEILKLHNIPLFVADKEAKLLNNSSKIVQRKLISHFGSEIYSDGVLNRKKLAELIFNNEENLKIANAIIHPELAKSFIYWCNNQNKSDIVAIEAAILIEAGFLKYIDKLITVYSPEELRIERVMRRDGSSRDEIIARMKNQIREEEKLKLSDYVIINDGHHSLIQQVTNVINLIITSKE